MSTICLQRHPLPGGTLNCGQPKKPFLTHFVNFGGSNVSHINYVMEIQIQIQQPTDLVYKKIRAVTQTGNSFLFYFWGLTSKTQLVMKLFFLVDLPSYRFSLKNDKTANVERCGAAYQSKPMVTQQVLVSASETTEVGNCATSSWLLARVWVGCPQCRAPMDGLACPVSGSLLRTLSTPFFSQ